MKTMRIVGCVRAVVATACVALCLNVRAAASTNVPVRVANDGFNDVIDRNDPDFVKASLLIFGPGLEFFGRAGHTSLRLECPAFGLDNCFTRESESIKDNFPRFFLGKLKMGMFAIPTDDFLKRYELAGRQCTQYKLNLPPDAERRLWEIMDTKVAQGRVLPYDYIRYCCVQSILQPILEAAGPNMVAFPPWPEKYAQTRREILAENLAWCPWTRLFLHTIAGTEVDRDVPNTRKVILSPDILALLRGTTINGRPMLEGEGEVLLPRQVEAKPVLVTPLAVAGLLVLLAVAGAVFDLRWVAWLFLVAQSLLGALLTHLVFISDLPATSWNWLIVPFNLLPLVFWKWRRHWALPFVGVLVLWELFMLLSPHRLTDPAYLVFVLAYVVLYVKIAIKDGPVFCLFQKR